VRLRDSDCVRVNPAPLVNASLLKNGTGGGAFVDSPVVTNCPYNSDRYTSDLVCGIVLDLRKSADSSGVGGGTENGLDQLVSPVFKLQ
jgi:hypothetical protein